MAAQVLKRSFWYWDMRDGEEEKEEEEEEVTEAGEPITTHTEKKQQKHSRLGVAVLLGWMLSERKHLAAFTRLYKSLGWDCLVCHPHVLNLFSPSMASTLALNILVELVKELERHPCPIVFITFSGGHKACLYKVIQILLDQCRGSKDCKDKFDVVVASVAGLIFDSSPVEFDSYIGAKFVSQQMLTKRPGRSNAIILHGARAFGRGLDAVFARQLGLQRIDLWHALYSCVNMGPILILCSENDELAPLETVHMFSSNLRKLGGKVDVVTWKDTKHVGHFRRYPEQYASEVRKLLANASGTYFDRRGRAETAALWTSIPECALFEIRQMSRMPHLQSKGGNAGDGGPSNVPHASEYGGPIAGQIDDRRSRL